MIPRLSTKRSLGRSSSFSFVLCVWVSWCATTTRRRTLLLLSSYPMRVQITTPIPAYLTLQRKLSAPDASSSGILFSKYASSSAKSFRSDSEKKPVFVVRVLSEDWNKRSPARSSTLLVDDPFFPVRILFSLASSVTTRTWRLRAMQ